jgi:hypothetical protein
MYGEIPDFHLVDEEHKLKDGEAEMMISRMLPLMK